MHWNFSCAWECSDQSSPEVADLGINPEKSSPRKKKNPEVTAEVIGGSLGVVAAPGADEFFHCAAGPAIIVAEDHWGGGASVEGGQSYPGNSFLSTAAGCHWGAVPFGPSWALPCWSLW